MPMGYSHTVSPLLDLGTRFTLLQPSVWFLNVWRCAGTLGKKRGASAAAEQLHDLPCLRPPTEPPSLPSMSQSRLSVTLALVGYLKVDFSAATCYGRREEEDVRDGDAHSLCLCFWPLLALALSPQEERETHIAIGWPMKCVLFLALFRTLAQSKTCE